ncbi:MAG: hypothetical protein MMC33_010532 [Icmadophila ericetorum]|nr:hypothetical protein [Icmadophila ericetorum]
MSRPQVRIPGVEVPSEDVQGDIEMGVREDEEEEVESVNEDEPEGGEEEVEQSAPQLTFIGYLKSPIVELLVGSGDGQTLLTAHQALLVQSPYFAGLVSELVENMRSKTIPLETEDLDAMGCFLQYLYTGEYYPKVLGDGKLESDKGGQTTDENGEQLLKHAKVYSLAGKFGVDELKSLALLKVHRVSAGARAEIAYARYVYANTPPTDVTIRKPIATFWGMRAYTLRHEAEPEFKALCLEHPTFGFDVLSYVLDRTEKKGGDKAAEEPKSSRKRPRAT